jgi:deoxycytidylate deaminase
VYEIKNMHGIWLQAAEQVAESSSCTRTKVGCIVVDDGFVAAGFNEVHDGKRKFGAAGLCGAGDCPRGTRSYAEQPPGGDYSDCFAMHAEIAAMRYFMMHRKVTEDTRLYVTRKPCNDCWSAILNFGLLMENVIWSN